MTPEEQVFDHAENIVKECATLIRSRIEGIDDSQMQLAVAMTVCDYLTAIMVSQHFHPDDYAGTVKEHCRHVGAALENHRKSRT